MRGIARVARYAFDLTIEQTHRVFSPSPVALMTQRFHFYKSTIHVDRRHRYIYIHIMIRDDFLLMISSFGTVRKRLKRAVWCRHCTSILRRKCVSTDHFCVIISFLLSLCDCRFERFEEKKQKYLYNQLSLKLVMYQI